MIIIETVHFVIFLGLILLIYNKVFSLKCVCFLFSHQELKSIKGPTQFVELFVVVDNSEVTTRSSFITCVLCMFSIWLHDSDGVCLVCSSSVTNMEARPDLEF